MKKLKIKKIKMKKSLALICFFFSFLFSVVQGPGLNVISELIIGYLYPGKPLANVCFKTYGTISMSQALSFTSDLKLGHYMKIPPKSMFIAQVNYK